jgi:hypothetical protein
MGNPVVGVLMAMVMVALIVGTVLLFGTFYVRFVATS